jgi:hypothetical protein
MRDRTTSNESLSPETHCKDYSFIFCVCINNLLISNEDKKTLIYRKQKKSNKYKVNVRAHSHIYDQRDYGLADREWITKLIDYLALRL